MIVKTRYAATAGVACMTAVMAAVSPRATLAAEDLIRFGTFERDPVETMKEVRGGTCTDRYGGKIDVFTEDLTWNKCLRLTAGPAFDEISSGKKTKVSGADVVFAGADGKGIPVAPDRFYDWSFELKGVPKRVSLHIYEYSTVNGKRVKRHVEKDIRFVPGKDWRRFKVRYRTGVDAEAVEFRFSMFTLLDSPKAFRNGFFKPGDCLLIDNVSLVRDDRSARLEAALEKAREPFRVAPYAVEADASCPFLPFELADPPEKIVFRAAVNEKKPLPVAIANLTGAFAQYRVVLETDPVPSPRRRLADNGAFGLKGYPKEKITVREALRFKDTEEPPVTLRLDPLVGMNEASVISVPPREAGAVWFDFDTYDVKPGVYRGRLRVIPLAGAARYKTQKGRYVRVRTDEKIIPVEFTVDPIVLSRESVRPAHLCSPCTTERGFGLESDIGVRFYHINTRFFRPEAVGNPDSEARRAIAGYLDWAGKRGSEIAFFVKYDAFGAAQNIFNPQNDPGRKWTAWEQYVHTLAKVMEEAGVPFKNYYVLLKDEPANDEIPDLQEGQRRLKHLYPQMQTYISACLRIEGDLDYFGYLSDTTDIWALSNDMCERPGMIEKIRAVKAKFGSKILHYRCSTSMREPLSGYFRRHCWRSEQGGFDADMLYHFTGYHFGPYAELDFKVIPRGEISYVLDGKVMPSVRYMAYREGVTDIKYVQALRDLRGNEPEIARFLKEAAEKVICTDPVSVALPGQIREEIRRLLLEGSAGTVKR